MTTVDSYHTARLPAARERHDRIRERAIAGLTSVTLITLAIAALALRFWLGLPH